MNQDERYVITLTPEQEIITEQALELLARLHIGQFERIAELLCDPREQDYHTRSWHENPQGGFTVNYDEPLNLSGGPMPKCEIIQDEKYKV